MKNLDDIIRELARKVMEQERGTWREEMRTRYAPWLSELTYGFEFKEGWRSLVVETLEEIARAVGGPAACPDLRITRLRQKFGFLTVQFKGLSSDHERAVARIFYDAGDRSMQTCEVCGRPGELRGEDYEGWAVECDEHSGRGREKQ